MNPLLIEALGAIIRWMLAALAGYLVKAGIWSADDASSYVAAAALFVIGLGWSLWQKYGMRAKLMVALSSSQTMTENQATAAARLITAPSVATPKDETPTKPKPQV